MVFIKVTDYYSIQRKKLIEINFNQLIHQFCSRTQIKSHVNCFMSSLGWPFKMKRWSSILSRTEIWGTVVIKFRVNLRAHLVALLTLWRLGSVSMKGCSTANSKNVSIWERIPCLINSKALSRFLARTDSEYKVSSA